MHLHANSRHLGVPSGWSRPGRPFPWAVPMAFLLLCLLVPSGVRAQGDIDTLNYAIADNDLEYVQELLDSGLNINAFNEVGLTPLIYAVETYAGDQEILSLLLDRGANVNQQITRNGKTALIKAVSQPETLCLAPLLLEKGADPNLEDRQGYVALWYALQLYGQEGVIAEELITAVTVMAEKGADLEITLQGGDTPLIFAAQNGLLDMVRIFVEHEASKDAKNEAGRTALDLAKENEQEEVVEFLESLESLDSTGGAEAPPAEKPPVG